MVTATTQRMRKIAACISAYNEEDTIGAVLEKTIPLVDELIVVDDGSKDDTGLIAEDFGALVIHHSRNLGKGVSLRHCLDTAAEMNIDIVATLDADGQHDPDEIPLLIQPIETAAADIVVGSRIVSGNAMRSMDLVTLASNSAVSYLLSTRYGGNLTDVQTGYRAFSKAALRRLLPHLRSTRFEIELEIICKARMLGMTLKEVPVTVHKREGGRTKFSFPLRLRSLCFAVKYALSPEAT